MFCLTTPTDPAWAREAAADLDAVLVDHAHCEMKAATNAMSLVMRHPGDLALVRALTELAREELDHFRRVLHFIDRRGLELGAPPVDAYAAELRTAMNRLPQANVPHVVDRLLVGALIEARSCERFKLLLDVLPAGTPSEIRVLYDELFACEARHYRTYVDLATQALRTAWSGASERDIESAIATRLGALAEAEGAIVRTLATRDARATVHG
ncbi:MAG: tRNA-(ms[2]io[6]A)-hydroxylase [Deltaproteobacteria bacterium]|nr:tRNA-(ms[2]io[6]A)-hydroxylase [Deltaproteobacteria bacterium]